MTKRLDLNRASKAELLGVQGIDNFRADAILRYREEHGRFSSVDDLQNVQGFRTGWPKYFAMISSCEKMRRRVGLGSAQ